MKLHVRAGKKPGERLPYHVNGIGKWAHERSLTLHEVIRGVVPMISLVLSR